MLVRAGIVLQKYLWWNANMTKPETCGALDAYFMNYFDIPLGHLTFLISISSTTWDISSKVLLATHCHLTKARIKTEITPIT